ncbi:MAG: hypothetical protein EAZ25_16625 [Oscillatoriales cyanobacterium]|nr:MAG: hypothetical protein EAZ88_08280 [Oscillatoriales cyanobacterium]TAG62720.1 MAG: hypothetical protein EAZ28_02260 [Oscillatoriales cyanobacterium]TAG65278.1 MAG: hypothetical protein EAZ25_16625 [Oscillatoriales cyanobacterium]
MQKSNFFTVRASPLAIYNRSRGRSHYKIKTSKLRCSRHWSLVIGHWSVVSSHWSWVIGNW